MCDRSAFPGQHIRFLTKKHRSNPFGQPVWTHIWTKIFSEHCHRQPTFFVGLIVPSHLMVVRSWVVSTALHTWIWLHIMLSFFLKNCDDINGLYHVTAVSREIQRSSNIFGTNKDSHRHQLLTKVIILLSSSWNYNGLVRFKMVYFMLLLCESKSCNGVNSRQTPPQANPRLF